MAGQVFSAGSLGGNYMALNLSDELRMGVRANSKFRQFCDVRDAWDKVTRSGQTFTWDVVPMMSRGNRALSETNTIPAGNHVVLQGTLTMSERGFSVPYTGFVEALAKFSVRQPLMKVLKYDAMCDIDALAFTEFNRTKLRYASSTTAAGTLTTNGTATQTSSQSINHLHVKDIVDQMKGRNIPSYTDSDYYAIARPAGLRALKNYIETVHQYTDQGLGMIMNGEIGRYENVRFVEQTVIPAGGAADTTTFDAFADTADAWNVSGADWCFLFGADTVCEAVHTVEEIRIKRTDDYDRSKGLAWYALLGYGITHPGSTATELVQARIVKYDSAV